MIKNVIFDIGAVLVHSQTREYFDPETEKKLRDVALRSEIWDKMDLGEASYAEVQRQILHDHPELASELELFFKVYQPSYHEVTEVADFLRAQKAAGRKVYLLSNFGRDLFEESVMGMDFYQCIDGEVISYREHLAKPDLRIYQLLLERYQLVPEECVFIDDKLENVLAARECGIHAIQFRDIEQLKQDFAELLD